MNAVICGFEKSSSLFKSKVNGWVRDEYYDPNEFIPDFESSCDDDEDDDKPSEGWRNRTNEEKLTLRTNFLEYNIWFWLAIFKYHPLFYHH